MGRLAPAVAGDAALADVGVASYTLCSFSDRVVSAAWFLQCVFFNVVIAAAHKVDGTIISPAPSVNKPTSVKVSGAMPANARIPKIIAGRFCQEIPENRSRIPPTK